MQNFHKKEKIGKQTELGDQLQKRFNNSAKKRTTRNYKLNEIDKNNKLNNTQNNLDNKIIENNYIDEMKQTIINNHNINIENNENENNPNDNNKEETQNQDNED